MKVQSDDPLTGIRHLLAGANVTRSGTVYPIPPYDVPPVVSATARPKISAVPRVGQTVSVTPAQWNTDVTLTDAWYAGSTKVGSALAYTPKTADVGKPLRLMVTATKGATEVSTNTLAREVK